MNLLLSPSDFHLPALTVSVDSYFWDRAFLWPEFNGIYFNVFEGKSSEWGVRFPCDSSRFATYSLLYFYPDLATFDIRDCFPTETHPRRTPPLHSRSHHRLACPPNHAPVSGIRRSD